MFNDNLFFDRENNPWESGRLFTERDVMDSFERQQEPFQQFTQQQAQQSIAPNQVPPNLGMAMPQSQGNPMLGSPQQQMMPPQAPQQGGFNTSAFLGSPGMAQANQALNNIYALRRGRAPTVSPTEAYQHSINRQAILAQRDKEMVLREKQEARREAMEVRAAEKFEIDKDPAYAFNKMKEQGVIPDDMKFKEFEQIGIRSSERTSVQKNMEMWDAMHPNANIQERQSAFAALARPTNIYAAGGGQQDVFNPLNPNRETLVDAVTATSREAAESGAKTSATEWAKTNQNFAVALQDKIPGIDQRMTDITRAIDIIKSGDGDFGPAASLLGDIYNPENAELNAIGMTGLLQTLSDVTTGALSEGEIKIFSQDIAQSDKSPASNLRLLERARDMMARSIGHIQRKGQYFIQNNGSLEGYDEYQLEALGKIVGGLSGKSKDGKITGPARPGG